MPNIKVLFMGDPGSGKTMTAKKIFLNIIDNIYVPTIAGKLYKYKNTKNKDIDVWDIGGNDPYPGITDAYCFNVNYCIIFSSVNVVKYLNIVRTHSPNVTIINFTNQTNLKNFLDNI